MTKVDDRNNAASPSPAVDEKGVYVFFPDYGLLAYDFDGNERWKHPLETFEKRLRHGSLARRRGRQRGSGLRPEPALVHRRSATGTPVRSRGRSTGPRRRAVTRLRSCTAILRVSSRSSYPARSSSRRTPRRPGRKLWWVTGLSFEMKSTPVLADGIVYINGYGAPENQPGTNVKAPTWTEALAAQDKDQDGLLSGEELQGTRAPGSASRISTRDQHLDEPEWRYYEAALASRNGILAIRVGGEGDMTEKNVAWAYHKRVPQLPSPLLYQGVLYMVNDGGVVTSLDPATGEMRSQGRLKGAVDNYYASPVAADGKIFMASELGKVAVVKPGGEPRGARGERSRGSHLRDPGDRRRTALRPNPGRAVLLRRIMILVALLLSLLALDAGGGSPRSRPARRYRKGRERSSTRACRWTRRTGMERRRSSSPPTKGISRSSSSSSARGARHRRRRHVLRHDAGGAGLRSQARGRRAFSAEARACREAAGSQVVRRDPAGGEVRERSRGRALLESTPPPARRRLRSMPRGDRPWRRSWESIETRRPVKSSRSRGRAAVSFSGMGEAGTTLDARPGPREFALEETRASSPSAAAAEWWSSFRSARSPTPRCSAPLEHGGDPGRRRKARRGVGRPDEPRRSSRRPGRRSGGRTARASPTVREFPSNGIRRRRRTSASRRPSRASASRAPSSGAIESSCLSAVSGASDRTFRTGLYGDVTPVDDLSEHRWLLYALDTRRRTYRLGARSSNGGRRGRSGIRSRARRTRPR